MSTHKKKKTKEQKTLWADVLCIQGPSYYDENTIFTSWLTNIIMKKVFRTFLITLILVWYAGIAGVIYLSQQQPERIQQFLGCTNTTQQQLHDDLIERLDNLDKKIAEVSTIVNQLEQRNEDGNETDSKKIEVQPAPAPVPLPSQQDNSTTTNETITQ